VLLIGISPVITVLKRPERSKKLPTKQRNESDYVQGPGLMNVPKKTKQAGKVTLLSWILTNAGVLKTVLKQNKCESYPFL
jgi:hypothetical protein